jgi:hypothetical protein
MAQRTDDISHGVYLRKKELTKKEHADRRFIQTAGRLFGQTTNEKLSAIDFQNLAKNRNAMLISSKIMILHALRRWP